MHLPTARSMRFQAKGFWWKLVKRKTADHSGSHANRSVKDFHGKCWPITSLFAGTYASCLCIERCVTVPSMWLSVVVQSGWAQLNEHPWFNMRWHICAHCVHGPLKVNHCILSQYYRDGKWDLSSALTIVTSATFFGSSLVSVVFRREQSFFHSLRWFTSQRSPTVGVRIGDDDPKRDPCSSCSWPFDGQF